MEQAHVADFLFQTPRLAPAGEPPEAGTPRTQRPGRDGDLKVNQLFDNALGNGFADFFEQVPVATAVGLSLITLCRRRLTSHFQFCAVVEM